jgi:hypothetical protein
VAKRGDKISFKVRELQEIEPMTAIVMGKCCTHRPKRNVGRCSKDSIFTLYTVNATPPQLSTKRPRELIMRLRLVCICRI